MGDPALLAAGGVQLAQPGLLAARRPDEDRRALADIAQAVGRRHRGERDLAAVERERGVRPREIAAAFIGDARRAAAVAGMGESGRAPLLMLRRAAGPQQQSELSGPRRAHRQTVIVLPT